MANPLNTTSASNVLADLLNTSDAAETLAIANQSGNKVATDNNLTEDLRGMTYGQVVQKYGGEVARNRFRYLKAENDLETIQNTPRNFNEIVDDTGLSIAAGATNIVGGLASLTALGLGGNTKIGNKAAVGIAELTGDAATAIKNQRSQNILEKERVSNIEAGLDKYDRDQEYNASIESGNNQFLSKVRREGQAILDTSERYLTDGPVAGSLIAEALGSLGPSAKVASVAANALGKTALSRSAALSAAVNPSTLNKARAAVLSPTAGAAVGVGISEASGVQSQAIQAVMALKPEQLAAGSKKYTDMIEAGIDPEDAKIQLAADTGRSAFIKQLPVATALGLISAKFEAAPITSFKGSSFVETLRGVGLQTLEEAGQGATGRYNQNNAVQQNADRNQDVFEGIGEDLASGAIAGAGIAGVVSTPNTVSEIVSEPIQNIQQTASDVLASAIEGPTNVSNTIKDKVFDVADKINDSITPVVNTVSNLVENTNTTNIKEKVSNVVDKAKEIVTGTTGTLVEKAEEINNKPNTTIRDENFQSAINAYETAAQEINEKGKDSDPVVLELLATREERKVPTKFAEVVESNGSAIENVAGVLSVIKDNDLKIEDMSAQELGFVVEQAQDLRDIANRTPPKIKSELAKVLSSPDLVRIQKAVEKIDLNQTQNETTEITDDVVSETVAVAKLNPTNLNPQVVNKILEQRSVDETITPEDIKLLKTGSKIAQVVNDYISSTVEISKQKIVQIKNQGKVKNLPKAITPDQVSRSITVDGFKDVKGNKKRSIADFASDIFEGVQSPDQIFTTDEGVQIPVTKVVEQLENFTQHMINKVEALNESYRQGNSARIRYDALVGDSFVQSKTGLGVTVGNAESEAINRQIHADTKVLVDVRNALQETFPEIFTQEAVNLPALELDTPSSNEQTDITDITQTEVNDFTPEQEALSEQSTDVLEDTLRENDPVVEESYIKDTRLTLEDYVEEQINGQKGSSNIFGIDPEIAKELIPNVISEISSGTITKNLNRSEQIAYDGLLALGKNYLETIYPELGIKNQVTKNDNTTADETLSEALAEDNVEETSQQTKEKAKDYKNISPKFNKIYLKSGDNVNYVNGFDLLDLITKQENHSEAYIQFMDEHLNGIIEGANDRLNDVIINKTGKSVAESVFEDDSITDIRDYKSAILMDRETGRYDEDLISIAAVAVLDWLSGAQISDPHQLEDTLEDLGLSYNDLNKDQIKSIIMGISPRQAVETVGRTIIRMWNLKPNVDASMGDIRGISEGIVKELLVVISETTDLIQVDNIPVKVDGKLQSAQTLNIQGVKQYQDEMGISGQNSIQQLLAPELTEKPSIGKKINEIDLTQSRGKVPLSDIERRALKNMQDTPHYISQGVSDLVRTIGYDLYSSMVGYNNLDGYEGNSVLEASITGKNISIQNDWDNAMAILEEVESNTTDEAVPVYYPVGVTKVGRHQFKGINPQNNKLLRAMITPTHSTLNMETKQDRDAFWLTVAQAADLFKVENEDHNKILSEVEAKFESEFGDAKRLILEWLKTGDLNKEQLVKDMGNVGPAELSAVLAVAQYEFAVFNDTANSFNTTLSFELDGKTDGPGNMMNNFGRGILSPLDFTNMNRIGYFLGRPNTSLNDYFSVGNVDLYEIVSRTAQSIFRNTKANNKETIDALERFTMMFGDFKLDDKSGEIVMTRNTSKSPVTKTVYGSGVRGVASGISDDMILEMYKQAYNKPKDVSLGEFMKYDQFEQDFNILFGGQFDSSDTTFQLDNGQSNTFADIVEDTLGAILSESAKSTVGDKITQVNDALKLVTNMQGDYLIAEFEERLNALGEQRATEDKIKRNKQGKPILTELTERDYQRIVKDMRKLSPMYDNGAQILSVGSFEPSAGDVASNTGGSGQMFMSAAIDGKFRQVSNTERPAQIGVKVIPYISIGRGDAMMMNTIYGSENAPTDTLPIFDGIDMPVNKVQSYSKQINEAVLKNWNRDVLGDIVKDMEGFILSVGLTNPKLEAAMKAAASRDKKSTVKVNSVEELLNLVRQYRLENLARKNVFKTLPVSVDHMGGSNNPFVRGSDQENVSFSKINELIQKELDRLQEIENKKTPIRDTFVDPYQNDLTEEVVDTKESTLNVVSGNTYIDALFKSTKDKVLLKTLKAIKNQIPKDIKIVQGTLDELNNYRQENYPDDGQIIKTKGSYDTKHNVIYIVGNNDSTAVHELIHAATFTKVESHYNGEANDTVQRLEDLMNEFMEKEFSSSSKSINTLKQVILENLAINTNYSKATALNEFMAWTLSNRDIAKKLENTETKLVEKWGKIISALMQRLFNTIPKDMFNNVLFNTQLLGETNIGNNDNGDNNNNNNNNNNDGGDITPSANNHTNYWINLLKEKLDEKFKTPKGSLTGVDASLKAEESLDLLKQGGFSMNDYQSETYKAIHAVIAMETTLNANSAEAMNGMFEFVTSNLTPDLIGSDERYQTVMDLFGATNNQENISDSLAVLLALSQTNKGFRDALSNMQIPEAVAGPTGTVNGELTRAVGFLMRKALQTVETSGKDAQSVMDELSKTIIRNDQEKEFTVLRSLMSGFDKADSVISGGFKTLANVTSELDSKQIDRNTITSKVISGAKLATSFLDADKSVSSGKDLKELTHLGTPWDFAIPIREFVTEIVGADISNAQTYALLDRTNKAVSAVRQAYREDLPVFLQNEFENHPTEEQWKVMHTGLAKTDLSVIFEVGKPDKVMNMFDKPNLIDDAILEVEEAIAANYTVQVTSEIIKKSSQLAKYMITGIPGIGLLKNAYSINQNSKAYDKEMTIEIDRLVSLYALKEMSNEDRKQISDMYKSDPVAVKNIITYIKGLNKEEDSKVISEAARLNGYKGYVPNTSKGNNRIVIRNDNEAEQLKKFGYVRVGNYTGESDYLTSSYGYYTTNVKQDGNYSQGVMQSVQNSYRGVDATSGFTAGGRVSGIIDSDSVQTVTDLINENKITVTDDFLIPIFDDAGEVVTYERVINPSIEEKYLDQKSHLGLMMGVWAGRQMEEKASTIYNREMVDQAKSMFDLEGNDVDNFVNLATSTDPIHQDSWRVIPADTKEYIEEVFGQDTFMVRRDMVNLAVGYREASVLDFWTGKSRWPEGFQKVAKSIAELSIGVTGMEAITVLSKAEETGQSAISSVKDLIVVRSLIVPYMNTQANVFQLATVGVPIKQTFEGYKSKFTETDRYNEIVSRKIELETRVRLNEAEPNKVKILEKQIKVLDDEAARMSIAPLVEAGAYKNISEGITDLDVQLTSGKLGDWVEAQMNKLPDGLQTVVKYGLVSKDTALYKGANKSVQYGDFIAKSILYDHLVNGGMESDKALEVVNEEFVNFSVLPGRVRSSLESNGLSWFMTFKIRIMKVAAKIAREHPARALVSSVGLQVDGPIEDNLLSVALEDDRLSYSTGYEMLWGAGGLNPWVQALDFVD